MNDGNPQNVHLIRSSIDQQHGASASPTAPDASERPKTSSAPIMSSVFIMYLFGM